MSAPRPSPSDSNPSKSPASNSPFVAAVVIVAAGDSTRMRSAGGTRKPLLELAGKTLLEHACEPFAASRFVRDIIVVAHHGDRERVLELARSLPSLSRVLRVVDGGDLRVDSVRAGVAAVPLDVDVIAVHDAARPFVETEAVDRTLATAAERGAALLGIPAVDTLKTTIDGYHAEHTLDRSVIWHAQTPQAFRASLLRELLERAAEEGVAPTDEANLYERFVGPVPLEKGSHDYFKITTPRDLELAEALLRLRAEARA